MPFRKYIPFHQQINVDGGGRTWPERVLEHAPRWCSVDLRDGNQALIEPMDTERKLAMWNLLVSLGFKEIEVGFPSASQTDFDFIRLLIEQELITDYVTIGVLTQAREHLIRKTYDCLKGAKRVYVHLYNSTSVLQRDVVFGLDQQGITNLAVEGAKLCKSLEHLLDGTEVYYEYSPESYTGTEPEFAAEISNAVAEVFGASKERPVIINLPSTVEMTTPNVYADSIEWMCRHLGAPTEIAPDDGKVAGREGLSFTRDELIVSLHPHNDQGMGIAAAQLGLLAGADRVEGCIFGNGERTGNVDTIAIALNLFTGGIDPELEIHDIKEIRRVYEHCNQLNVPERYPYAGDLVFTAFSGSHQDAIKKGTEAREARGSETWAVPYLPIDPADIGASYESVIRVNSQSGKGGIAYILKNKHNLDLPKRLQIEFSRVVQNWTDQSGKEISDTDIFRTFCDEYLPSEEINHDELQLDSWGRLKVLAISDTITRDGAESVLKVRVNDRGEEHELVGVGNGPIDAFIAAVAPLVSDLGDIQILDYNQHAMTTGQDAEAAAYIECRVGNLDLWGVGIDPSTTKASLKAIASAVNRAARTIQEGK
jgi:2-isopropylmalate synthase